MNIFKSVLASAAIAGALVSQTAAASAPVSRAGSPVSKSDELGVSAASAPFLAVFAIFLITGLVILITDDDDSPVSP
jgi:hypothetical protein